MGESKEGERSGKGGKKEGEREEVRQERGSEETTNAGEEGENR